jgi:hypothetical protein
VVCGGFVVTVASVTGEATFVVFVGAGMDVEFVGIVVGVVMDAAVVVVFVKIIGVLVVPVVGVAIGDVVFVGVEVEVGAAGVVPPPWAKISF